VHKTWGESAAPAISALVFFRPVLSRTAGDSSSEIVLQHHRFAAGVSALVPVGPRKSLILRCVNVCT